MSLYHEAADILSEAAGGGGNLKSKVFSNKTLKSPVAQVYALALETCKWSPVLKEIIEKADLLRLERKLTPVLSLLLVHDLLLAKGGISLPTSHGLRASVERHRARLSSELARARIRRHAPTVELLRSQVDAQAQQAGYPRWVRINTLVTCLEDQLDTTFAHFERVLNIKAVIVPNGEKLIYIDPHIPNLVAASPNVDLTKTEAYASGAIILQDKASCFPAYLLDPGSEDGDVLDACAAPGNKTTHLAAILYQHHPDPMHFDQAVIACEKDRTRAGTLDKMVKKAAADQICKLLLGQDFLKIDPNDPRYRNVGALLLDPSCSGSGIVGRDCIPTIHLPRDSIEGNPQPKLDGSKKRKRETNEEEEGQQESRALVDDDGGMILVGSDPELEERLGALSSFQLMLLLHAFKFPSAKKITYSTCSIYAEENEKVVGRALQSHVARARGWKILARKDQVRGLREWPIRGELASCDSNEGIADAVIRSYKDDGRGVMGFFVAGFVRDDKAASLVEREDRRGDGASRDGKEEPYVRDESGMVVRDPSTGMPVLKRTGKPVPLPEEIHIRAPSANAGGGGEDSDDDGPYVKDENGMIVRDDEGMPFLRRKPSTSTGLLLGPLETVAEEEGVEAGEEEEEEEEEEEWEGFDD
ncbi:hypothetical protein MKZ38_007570 [Zalerion maritima]|uniref:SAM-dependent MTase RsmB/NOP-type domain-containing protein n=1 Tax=Zalerion maritima TaxID=339359 RepID=A0AAD5RWK5_9PEZI|nr:hypothetical protein MKZ38_007570 [Zalerion maritima]